MARVFISYSYVFHLYFIVFKGEFRMEKVKVTRYIPGRRPDYAIQSSSEEEEESDSDDEGNHAKIEEEEALGVVRIREDELEGQRMEYNETEVSRDRRLARLRERSTYVERYFFTVLNILAQHSIIVIVPFYCVFLWGRVSHPLVDSFLSYQYHM